MSLPAPSICPGTMKKLSFSNWLKRTEQVITEALGEILERDWDENDATKSWMRALRRELKDVEVTDLGRPYAMEWDTLKLTGKPENLYGDIAVLVRIDYPNGVRTEGVGFIEAKRIYESGDYDQLKSDQLERMLNGTAYHRLGLYDQTPIEEAPYGLAGHGLASALNKMRESRPPWNRVVAAVVPTPVALKMKGKGRGDLHPASLPLSYQLCARYLGGYDLDYSPNLIDAVKAGDKGAPKWLLIGHAVIGGETRPSNDNLVTLLDGPYSSIDAPMQEVGATVDLESKKQDQEDEHEQEHEEEHEEEQTVTARAEPPRLQMRMRTQ